MGMLLFGVFFVGAVIIVPWFIWRMACDLFGITHPTLRKAALVAIMVANWQMWQLPPETPAAPSGAAVPAAQP